MSPRNPYEFLVAQYWLLCRLHRVNRWSPKATSLLSELLQSSHDNIKIRAADLWYRLSEKERGNV